MDSAGEGTSATARRKQERDKAPAQKRPTRSQKLSPAARVIRQLRETVFLHPDTRATKRQVLHQSKKYIEELENTLESLLKMREDKIPCSLEDVKEEYLQFYYSDLGTVPSLEARSESESAVWFLQHQCEGDLRNDEEELKPEETLSLECSSPDLMEFERYLLFYKQTVDMLVESGVVASEQVTHPVVSKTISCLWQDLSQEGRADLYQRCRQRADSMACSLSHTKEPGSAEGCIRDSGAESQEASGSFVSSTPEEILFEDAFDIAASFLESGAVQNTSSPSSAHENAPWESPEVDSLLYGQIVGFLRSRFCSYAKEEALQYDYETVLLRCTETFDDEDDL
ncbi:stimulated by retinoic acid gene 8 protein homolog [Spea bombifrons]|uniref:stimulated by retinoic acid gene 8 protein homolog n=1 Tax=Spea bombifrons TaxID=233779 RepID=UPI00234AC749|nr:stimulated by retinoic acid gene 8 protein homolog [Spea bombifrons]